MPNAPTNEFPIDRTRAQFRQHAQQQAASQGIVSSTRQSVLTGITHAHLNELSYAGPKPEGTTDNENLALTAHRHLSEVPTDMMKVVELAGAYSRDTTITEAAAYMLTGEAIEKAVEEKCELLDVVRMRLTNRLSEVRNEIETLRQPPPGRAHLHAQAAEIRAELRSMSEGKRYDFIAKVMESREGEVMAYAIASAPSFLSGVTGAKHAQAVDFVLSLRKPQLLGVEDMLTANIARYDKAIEGLRRVFYGSFDRERVKQIRALAMSRR